MKNFDLIAITLVKILSKGAFDHAKNGSHKWAHLS